MTAGLPIITDAASCMNSVLLRHDLAKKKMPSDDVERQKIGEPEMLSIYALTWLGVLAAQISPGPNLAAVAYVGLAQGRKPALCVVAGISSGVLVWSAATALGLGALIEAFPLSLLFLKFLGGGYLLFLGIKAARATLKGGGSTNFAPDTCSLSYGLA